MGIASYDSANSRYDSSRKYVNQLCHDGQLAIICFGDDDGIELRVDRLQSDPGMAPGVSVRDPLAMVSLEGVSRSGLRIDRAAKLHQHGLVLPAPLHR